MIGGGTEKPTALSIFVMAMMLAIPVVLPTMGYSFENQNYPDRPQSAGPGDNIKVTSIDYEPVPLYRLLGMAELAVIGKVAEIFDTTFAFSITDTLIGSPESGKILVRKAIYFQFAEPGGAPYDTGQTFLLFLERDTLSSDLMLWRSYGAAGEAEMPVDSGYVYFNGRYIPEIEPGNYRVHGTDREIQRYDSAIFENAVRDYGRCFSWSADARLGRGAPGLICDESFLERYRARSWIHEYLTRETLKRIPR